MFCAPVFFLILVFFSLSNFVIPSKCLKNFICAASKTLFVVNIVPINILSVMQVCCYNLCGFLLTFIASSIFNFDIWVPNLSGRKYVNSCHHNSSNSLFLFICPYLALPCLPFVTYVFAIYLLTRHQYVCLILRQHEVWFINFSQYDWILQHRVDEDANIHIHNQVDKGLWVGLQTTNLIYKTYWPYNILFLYVYHLWDTAGLLAVNNHSNTHITLFIIVLKSYSVV